ncbi:MAG: hypothetical protein DME04_15490 [Candidatus Rokuibacteriota bacterium]|nr:MAG: hypothetical protein DME04_15490 [Candidatus Rokubacteria bacterium]
MLTKGPQGVAGRPENLGEPTPIAEPLSDRDHLLEGLHLSLEVAERDQRRAQPSHHVVHPHHPLSALGELAQRGKRLLGAARRVAKRPSLRRSLRGLPQMFDGLVPDVGVTVVEADRQRLDVWVILPGSLQRLGDPPMEQLAAGRQDACVGDVANPVVGEVEALAQTMEDAPAHHLLDTGRRIVLGEPGNPMQQRELELAPDHGGHAGERVPAFGQALEPPADEVAHPFGKRPTARAADRRALRICPRGLHRNERVALARRPRLLAEPLDCGLITAPRDRPDERQRVGV